jgi:hypothetical protein
MTNRNLCTWLKVPCKMPSGASRFARYSHTFISKAVLVGWRGWRAATGAPRPPATESRASPPPLRLNNRLTRSSAAHARACVQVGGWKR